MLAFDKNTDYVLAKSQDVIVKVKAILRASNGKVAKCDVTRGSLTTEEYVRIEDVVVQVRNSSNIKVLYSILNSDESQ